MNRISHCIYHSWRQTTITIHHCERPEDCRAEGRGLVRPGTSVRAGCRVGGRASPFSCAEVREGEGVPAITDDVAVCRGDDGEGETQRRSSRLRLRRRWRPSQLWHGA